MDCPDADQVLALLEGRLEPAAASELEAHVDGCADCRQLLAELVRSTSAHPRGPSTQLDTDAQLDPTASAQTRLIKPGGRVSHYQVDRVVGVGGMGVVYGARDVRSGRDVAIKMMRKSLADDPDMRARFIREADLMASLDHPNVVRVFEAGEHEGFPWLAMELVSGPTLEELQREEPWRVTLGHYLEAAAGLGAAHRRGIVHRDFKAPNVLIVQGGHAKLGDFGVAHEHGSALTRTGQVLGTLHYLAPECLTANKVLPASDQFAFAASLWRGLYAVRPFDGATPEAVYESIVRGQPQRPTAPHQVPAAVEAVLLRALSAKPELRYPTMEALAADLRRVALPSRSSALLPVAAAAGLALAAGVWFLAPRAGEGPAALARSGRSAEALAAAAQLAPGLTGTPRLEQARAHAGVLLAVGRADLAEALLAHELESTTGVETAAVASAVLVRAHALHALGRAAEADAQYERAVGLWSAVPGAHDGELEYAVAARAAASGAAQLPISVEALARVVPSDDLRLAAARLWLGEAALEAGDFALATDALTRASSAFEKANGEAHASAARARAGLAESELAGGQVDAAEARASAALKLRSAVLGEQHPELAREWSVLAWVALRRHDAAAAKHALEQVAHLGAGARELQWRADEARGVSERLTRGQGPAAGDSRLAKLLGQP